MGRTADADEVATFLYCGDDGQRPNVSTGGSEVIQGGTQVDLCVGLMVLAVGTIATGLIGADFDFPDDRGAMLK